ncbi:MAG TPA: MraY family glycosyltransferase [Actinomycetota bacterium]|nr:MraY family glycosyltransferase [Actinomycetota bacterium]
MPRPPVGQYAIVALVALLVTYAVTPFVRRLAVRIDAVDIPRDRKVHHAPTPTIGGLAIYAGILAAFAAAAAFPAIRSAFRFSEVFGLLVGGMIPLLIGLADDRHDISVGARLAGQVLAAGILFISGVKLSYFWLPGVGVLYLSPDVSAILTIFWIVFLMNAVNFVDGLDGLAAGLTAIAAGALFVWSLQLPGEFLGPDPIAPLVAVALFGACLGFLRYNFNPARIFMGDSGAYPLGFLLAGATISVIGRFAGTPEAVGRVALPLVFTPIVFLALPITDLLFAVFRRLATGRPIYTPDKEHIHHRLMRLGHSHRQAVLVMYGWALLLSGGLVVAAVLPLGRFLLAFAVAGGTIAVATLTPLWRGGNGNGDREWTEPSPGPAEPQARGVARQPGPGV